MTDTRLHHRLFASLPCKILFGGKKASAVLLDFSLGGALVSSSLRIPNDSPISLQIKVPEIGGTAKINGYVIRVITRHAIYRYGVRIDSIPSEGLALFKRLISLGYTSDAGEEAGPRGNPDD